VSESVTIRRARPGDLDELVELMQALQDHLEAANADLWRLRPEARPDLKGQLAGRLASAGQQRPAAGQQRPAAGQQRPAGAFALVAEHRDAGLVGAIFGRIATNKRYDPQRAGLIDQLYVRPEHRRAGIGRRLVAELCRLLAAEAIDDLSLRYVVGNDEAAAFWSALGFAPRIVTAGAHRERIK
jgi:ribosomal protein S18 acetylase RimI-like enzyme